MLSSFSSTQNIPFVLEKLGRNVIALSKFHGFNHIDFTYGRDLKIVHRKILRILSMFH